MQIALVQREQIELYKNLHYFMFSPFKITSKPSIKILCLFILFGCLFLIFTLPKLTLTKAKTYL